MSQYPHPYGYGQYHGPPPPPPYAYQNLPGYPALGHSTPYNPAAAQINRDASQAAYDLNAIHIPGLGVGGTTPAGTPLNLAPGVATWTQPHAFPTSAPNIPPPQSSGTGPLNSQVPPPGLPSGPRNGAQPAGQPPAAATHSIADVEMEEGELSEGQFEDLYEPREYVPVPPAQSGSKPLPLPITDPSQPASAADTPDGGFYGTDEDDGGKASRGNEVRERSASYSPFLSPREIQSGVPTPQPGADKGAQQGPGQRTVDTPKPAVHGLQATDRTPTTTITNSGAAHARGSASELKDSLGSFKSLQEAKKEAQKAILRLWPLGVKYQNYIDEGFDENLIKGLFRDLHLDMPKSTGDSSANQPKGTQPRQDGESATTKTDQASKVQSPQPTSAAKDVSTMSDQLRKGEERKDRIARLLAAKAAKAPAAPKPPSPATAQANVAVKPTQSAPETQPQGTASAPSTTAPPKSKAWGEKERLIQQKIAALQKSREQKSAADPVGAGAVQASNNGTLVPQTKATISPALLSIPTGPRAASISQTSASTQPTPSQPRLPIPGITMPSNAQTNSSSQRKRPVASDFVEYSSALPKRPFGQPRNETSLIIDVSDESDDEEMDMEMDMGSPVDETLPIRSSGGSNQRGPAIRDFPPLTDNFPQRQFSSPAPSITPPGGLVNHKKRTELDMKEKAIQDMRRKIALAEARRKVKQSSGGSVTPNQTGSFSELKENETPRLPPTESIESLSSPDRSDRPSPQLTPEPSSAKLPKPSKALRLDPLVRTERRGRLLSLEIPRVESSLTEKLNRLQQLRDEEARLQAEIDRSLAEQKSLADELQQLDTTPPSESPQPNGLGSGDEPSSSSASHAVEETGDQEETVASVLQPGSTTADTQMEMSSLTPSVSDESRGQGELAPADGSAEESIAGPANEGVVTGSDEASERAPDPSTAIEPPVAKGDVTTQEDGANASVSPPVSQPAESTLPALDIPEHVAEAANAEENTPMELDSRSPSPEVADPSSGIDTQPRAQLPDQISRAAQPREEVQEIEAEATGEVNVVSSRGPGSLWLTKGQVRDRPVAKSGTTLMPYRSPLRYFHSYRFHPEYQHSVAGGLKSLTYSNRIDPDKELCPFELTGDQCPANCEFQHLGSICPPDDQILLELGNPDDYSGEQKSRFIQGLRELLQKFKADKVKDFDTIARGIIEFRSQLLGDKSKVLRLDGVKL